VEIAEKEIAMSLTLGTTRHFRLPTPSVIWRALVAGVKRIRRDAALRREMERMDDHMLSDLGLSRAQMTFEVDRRA
jgi:uncharacterized protein YjiS (DUF1127 family)